MAAGTRRHTIGATALCLKQQGVAVQGNMSADPERHLQPASSPFLLQAKAALMHSLEGHHLIEHAAQGPQVAVVRVQAPSPHLQAQPATGRAVNTPCPQPSYNLRWSGPVVLRQSLSPSPQVPCTLAYRSASWQSQSCAALIHRARAVPGLLLSPCLWSSVTSSWFASSAHAITTGRERRQSNELWLLRNCSHCPMAYLVRAFATPRSPILRTSFWHRKMLAGLISRWMMLEACSACRPLQDGSGGKAIAR